jgi:hypothetical protein
MPCIGAQVQPSGFALVYNLGGKETRREIAPFVEV